jgi:ADP-heptose:LPS heptosyltransferase
LDRFRELAKQIRAPVQWCAGPEEDLPEAVRIGDLYGLGCWLRQARLYIGNDSGISHLAAAVGTPAVTIFGPTDPAVWAPQGAHVTVIRAPGGDLQELSVQDVAAVVDNMLKLT